MNRHVNVSIENGVGLESFDSALLDFDLERRSLCGDQRLVTIDSREDRPVARDEQAFTVLKDLATV